MKRIFSQRNHLYKGDPMKKNQIVMIHGTDFVNMTLTLLESIHLDEIIGDRHARIALKPNLLLPNRPEN